MPGTADNPFAGLGDDSLASAAGGGALGESVPAEPITDGAGQLGDLTPDEIAQIQSVVDQAGRPLEVVGSAARGTRGPGSDIDYTTANANIPNYTSSGLEDLLPGHLDHGILHGLQDPFKGPAIRFEPFSRPVFLPGVEG